MFTTYKLEVSNALGDYKVDISKLVGRVFLSICYNIKIYVGNVILIYVVLLKLFFWAPFKVRSWLFALRNIFMATIINTHQRTIHWMPIITHLWMNLK
jgi:hypothetical protein